MLLTRDIAEKVVKTVDAGLCRGVGAQVEGQMCVEAAVCFAFGLPHGDNPPCVGASVRSFKITLNDKSWSSNQARAKGMRKIAVAQLGSDTINQTEFLTKLVLKLVQRILPKTLRLVGSMMKKQNEAHAARLEECAAACEQSTGIASAKYAANAASVAAYAAYAAANAAANAANAASVAAYAASAATNAAYAASAAASASNAASAAAYAAYAANAANAASAAAAYAAAANAAANAANAASAAAYDEILGLMADCALEALIELKSPGCEWLDLVSE